MYPIFFTLLFDSNLQSIYITLQQIYQFLKNLKLLSVNEDLLLVFVYFVPVDKILSFIKSKQNSTSRAKILKTPIEHPKVEYVKERK